MEFFQRLSSEDACQAARNGGDARKSQRRKQWCIGIQPFLLPRSPTQAHQTCRADKKKNLAFTPDKRRTGHPHPIAHAQTEISATSDTRTGARRRNYRHHLRPNLSTPGTRAVFGGKQVHYICWMGPKSVSSTLERTYILSLLYLFCSFVSPLVNACLFVVFGWLSHRLSLRQTYSLNPPPKVCVQRRK